MDLHTWLDKPENKGRAVALAQYLAVSKTAVSLWRTNGVPINHMAGVLAFTEGAVDITSMAEHAMRCRAKSTDLPEQTAPEAQQAA